MSTVNPNTTFPQSFQNFSQFIDITSSDVALLEQFYNYIYANDFANANRVLQLIPNYEQKIMYAKKMNTLIDTIKELEIFWTDNIQNEITAKQQEWQNIINQFSYISTYSPTTQYVKNNIVAYTVNGLNQLYICTNKPMVGITPTNTTYWRVFTVRGAKGVAGVGANFSFDWNSATNYTKDTIAVYNNSWWNATQPSTNQPPYEGSAYWNLVLTATQSIYPISENQPTALKTGELWFRVLT